MKVLVIGGGGREHVLAWKLTQSPRVKKLYAAPGNPGIARLGECLPIGAEEIDRLLKVAVQEGIDWTIVGPEAPLCAGIVDRFAAKGLKVFGPTQMAAQLEGSKVFSKEFMVTHQIPTADFQVFTDIRSARNYTQEKGLPLVIKADGLAAGKGVFVCHEETEVAEALDQIFTKKVFGAAGERVLIEDCLEGVETSFLVFSDGDNVLPLEPAKDHKPIFDGNRGPNTGGMGTYSPTPTITPELQDKILSKIVLPTIHGMKLGGAPFRGLLYVGLMLTDRGPFVLEYNVRFGDPEAQVILPRLKTDLIDVLEATEQGTLGSLSLEWDPRSCLCVVLASPGYPGSYPKGLPIAGLETVTDPTVFAFHAGTKQEGNQIVTSGGRVLGITALGEDLKAAHDKAYAAVAKIHFDGAHCRKDIGL